MSPFKYAWKDIPGLNHEWELTGPGLVRLFDGLKGLLTNYDHL